MFLAVKQLKSLNVKTSMTEHVSKDFLQNVFKVEV